MKVKYEYYSEIIARCICRNTVLIVNNLMRNINNVLRRNRRIMEELIPDEKAIVSRDKLNDLGFNFAYITHTYTTRKGAVYHFCYDYGYLEIGNDLFTLVYRKKGSQLSESA
jgi:hypothetical protein